jgi:hypothetical protein
LPAATFSVPSVFFGLAQAVSGLEVRSFAVHAVFSSPSGLYAKHCRSSMPVADSDMEVTLPAGS